MVAARLTPDRYLHLLRRDGERLLETADGSFDLPVPGCPGWTVTDLLAHVGSVYAHKVSVLRLGRRPEPGEWAQADEGADPASALAWCHGWLHGVAGALAHRDPASPTWTFWDGDSTVAFWYRRMAHETSVHRVDAQAAVGPIEPIAADLALDGIDELLDALLEAASADTGVAAPPFTLAVGSGGLVTVDLCDVAVSGDPSSVLLWLWGRADASTVRIQGSPDDVTALVDLLRAGTQ